MQAVFNRWQTRFGFGLLLFTFTELVGWQTAPINSLLDWLALVGVYVALVGLSLDLLVRWYINVRVNLVLAAGAFGIIHGAAISTNISRNLPLSLVLFATAVPVLTFLLAYFSFRLLYTNTVPARYLLIGAPLVGLVHGIWTRWLPETDSVALAVPPLNTIAPYSVLLLLACALVLYIQTLPAQIDRFDWLLTPYEVAACIIVLIVVVVARSDAGLISTFGLALSSVLLGVFVGLARFYRSTIPDLPIRWSLTIAPQRQTVIRWVVMLLPFGIAAWVGYNLPGNSANAIQATFLFGFLLFFGIMWPPLLAFFISMQAFVELGRQEF